MKEEFCCKMVFSGYTHGPCAKKAKVIRDGEPYCGIHDPENVKKRRDKQLSKYMKERDEDMRRRKFDTDTAAFREKCVKTVRMIALGVDDPQGFCLNLLKMEP